MKEPIHKNVLPNTYIPFNNPVTISRYLENCTKQSLYQFCILWLKLKNTQPPIPKDSNYSQPGINNRISNEIKVCQSQSSYNKKQLIKHLVRDWWFEGLNLLQLSQVDCQLIVDRPKIFNWVYSVIKDGENNLVSISLNPKEFLDNLISKLSKVFFNYIYICKHPNLPIILIRIQMFDLNLATIRENLKVHTTSSKPYFFAIPLNSPNIIHSLGNDLVHQIVIESIERSLPQNSNNLLKIENPKDQIPINSLESIFLLKGGNSRFANSLGIWTPYADGTVDMLPLGSIEDHVLMKQARALEDEPKRKGKKLKPEQIKLERLKKIANLRFKGSLDGTLKSETLFEDNENRKKRKLDEEEVSEYKSIAPVQYAEFSIQDKVDLLNDHVTSIKFKLSGTDVFAGLHELSVLTPDDRLMIVNPEEIPDWLTGEENSTKGIVRNGNFTKD